MFSFADPVVRPSSGRGACPTFFRACCFEASRQNAHGHRVGYDHPGYQLTVNLEGLGPYEVEPEEWSKAIDGLVDLLQAADDYAILEWFCEWLPRCMELVPRRRRKTFLRGVYEAAVHNDWIFELPNDE
jgi:hypothetical protein